MPAYDTAGMADDEVASVRRRRDPIRELLTFHGVLRRALRELDEMGERPPGQVTAREAHRMLELLKGPLIWHDLDEETLLIPAIRRRLQPRLLDQALARASREHEAMEDLVTGLLPHLDDVAQGAPSNPVLLKTAANDLVALLLPHLEHEERDLFPLARALLTEDDLDEIGAALAERQALRSDEQR